MSDLGFVWSVNLFSYMILGEILSELSGELEKILVYGVSFVNSLSGPRELRENEGEEGCETLKSLC